MPLMKAPKHATKKKLNETISDNIHELLKAHPEWPRDRIIAASISAAKRNRKKK